jgi:hypothetical protein
MICISLAISFETKMVKPDLSCLTLLRNADCHKGVSGLWGLSAVANLRIP